MSVSSFAGLYTPVVTPFTASGISTMPHCGATSSATFERR